jgi:hypothetical protein
MVAALDKRNGINAQPDIDKFNARRREPITDPQKDV